MFSLIFEGKSFSLILRKMSWFGKHFPKTFVSTNMRKLEKCFPSYQTHFKYKTQKKTVDNKISRRENNNQEWKIIATIILLFQMRVLQSL